ncbi:MAG: multidrug resistance protein MdtO [Chthoniobacter sp.]|jgi:uncharacterized membrane protein YccC|nr:multidrug resistance protein MdtO [Chthoniobacter sp.]
MDAASLPAAEMSWLAWLRRELAPAPGRSENAVRITVTVVLVVVIAMTLRVPEAAVSAYMVFFVTKAHRKATALVGILMILGVTIGIALSLLMYRLTIDRPELRIPGMAVMLFTGMFLSRVFEIGPLAFMLGFILSVTQSVAELAPSGELLVRAMLWLLVAIVYPIAITVVVSQFLLPVHAPPQPTVAKKKKPLLAPDAFTNPKYARFALKVTLAAMSCYILYTAVDWAGIHTAFITCIFIALEDTESTLYKGLLRIVGCLIGALLGFLSILYLVPHMETIASLVLLIGAVSLGAAWIGMGSERIAYAGLQIAFAFFMCLLQGFGPDTDFDTIRDRIVGILLGIVMMTLIFCFLWPERSDDRLRPALGRALRKTAPRST